MGEKVGQKSLDEQVDDRQVRIRVNPPEDRRGVNVLRIELDPHEAIHDEGGRQSRGVERARGVGRGCPDAHRRERHQRRIVEIDDIGADDRRPPGRLVDVVLEAVILPAQDGLADPITERSIRQFTRDRRSDNDEQPGCVVRVVRLFIMHAGSIVSDVARHNRTSKHPNRAVRLRSASVAVDDAVMSTIVHRRPCAGFSLIELMIVVAIMAILAAIAYPKFVDATSEARDSATSSQLRVLRTAIERYRADHGGDPTMTDWTALVGNGYLKATPLNPNNNLSVIAGGAGTGVGWVWRARSESDSTMELYATNEAQTGEFVE